MHLGLVGLKVGDLNVGVTMRNTLSMFVLAGMAVMLAGCGGTKLIGGRTLPDETRVVDGPSLALPPDFELRPPEKTQDYEAVLRAQKTAEAKGLILGNQVGNVSETTTPMQGATMVSGQDSWLTEQAGAADGDIRSQLDKDAEEAAKEPPSWWDRVRGKGNK